MTDDPSAPDSELSSKINATTPHSARIWNYWLGGKDNYPVDRVVGDQFREAFPSIVDNARAFRYFLARVIRHLAAEAGVRQFLDVGTGLPTVDNTHEIAQRVAPECRIVYVDNDPLVLAHARALLTSTPEGKTNYLDIDLADTSTILEAAAATLDFTQPVALILSGILGHVTDDDEAQAIVRRLLEGLPAGSYLMVCDGVNTSEALNTAQDSHNQSGTVVYKLRDPWRIAAFFDGLELLEPGVVSCPAWRPDVVDLDPGEVHAYGGVGRKPSSVG